jgi:serine/threonine protein kinase
MTSGPTPSPAADRFRVTLTVTEGTHRGAVYSFGEHDMFVVGRSPEAHFSLPDDPYFSRLHFLIEVNPPLCRLLDLRSRNGTEVNRRKVTAADLQDGDEIKGGQTVLRVAIERPAPPGVEATRDLPAGPPAAAMDSPLLPPLPSEVIADVSLVPPRRPGDPRLPHRAQTRRGRHGHRLAGPAGVRRLPGGAEDDQAGRHPGRTVVQRFLREASILQRLQHPHIVAFHGEGEAGGLLYFVMEYVPGKDAQRLVREQGSQPVGRAVRLVCQLLEALAYAHGLGFVHRDLKPANLLVSEGGQGVAKLADFGLARAYQASPLSGLTVLGAGGGTPGFMPPEQVLDFRSAKPAADQYSAAATLYYLLTGKLLYDGAKDATALLALVLQEEPVPLRQRRPELPEGLAAAVQRALARKPEGRFADVDRLRQALLPFAGA